MFAGPNGSGKSTIFNEIRIKFDLGIYLNADEIEMALNRDKVIFFKEYGLNQVSASKFSSFFNNHSLYQKAKDLGVKIDLYSGDACIISKSEPSNSYEASIVVDFLRNELIEAKKKVTFETVMSHQSKIEILKKSKSLGFRNYLYFIATENPEINKSRVAERVKNGGHDVPLDKIEERYYKSLSRLKQAVSLTHRAFIFDNSGSRSELILDIRQGDLVTYQTDNIPIWVDFYLLQA